MSSLISIIIPLYNRQNLIVETLESVSNQTYQNWECIIVDDGSSDSSYQVVENYIKDRNRFKLFKRPSGFKGGGGGARNYGYSKSSGDFVMWLDSDDLMDKNKLELQINDLMEYNADLSISIWSYFPNKEELIKYPHQLFNSQKVTNFYEVLRSMQEEKAFLACHSYLVKRDIIQKSGLWLEFLKINIDGEFFNRVLINSQKIVLNNNTKAWYRLHGGEKVSSITSSKKIRHKIASINIIQNYLNVIDPIYFKDFSKFNKSYLFKLLINSNQNDIIKEYKYFFQEQLEDYNSNHTRYMRFKSKIYKIIYSKSKTNQSTKKY